MNIANRSQTPVHRHHQLSTNYLVNITEINKFINITKTIFCIHEHHQLKNIPLFVDIPKCHLRSSFTSLKQSNSLTSQKHYLLSMNINNQKSHPFSQTSPNTFTQFVNQVRKKRFHLHHQKNTVQFININKKSYTSSLYE